MSSGCGYLFAWQQMTTMRLHLAQNGKPPIYSQCNADSTPSPTVYFTASDPQSRLPASKTIILYHAQPGISWTSQIVANALQLVVGRSRSERKRYRKASATDYLTSSALPSANGARQAMSSTSEPSPQTIDGSQHGAVVRGSLGPEADEALFHFMTLISYLEESCWLEGGSVWSCIVWSA